MLTFTLDKQGRKHWTLVHSGVKFTCVNEDVGKELFKLLTQRAVVVKEVY
jgi:hydrogenase maturation factor